jgi:RNA polymerase sigma-70 factor (ECF subfamily)
MSAMNTDLVMITDIRADCEQAFLSAYNQYHQKLYFYFRSKTRSQHLSEELVQLTFIKLWQYRSHLNPQLPFSQQLFRIAKTTLIDLLRQKAANRLVPLHNIGHTEVADEATLVHDNHQLQLVQESLAYLPPMQQQIVAFRLNGLSNKEIASTLCISKKTVENQVNRAIREIKKVAGNAVVAVCIIKLLA